MDRKQLLFIIFVTVIVAIATVETINSFRNVDPPNLDAVQNDMEQIASSARDYYMQSDKINDEVNSFSKMKFTDVAFSSEDQITSDGLKAENENGEYKLDVNSSSSFTITAIPAKTEGNIVAYVESDCMQISNYSANGDASSPDECSDDS